MSHADRRYTYLRVLFRASSSQTANYKHKAWLRAHVLTRLSLSANRCHRRTRCAA